jgi:UDP-2,3-diacylglucosamine pyrophosphatase LpxH
MVNDAIILSDVHLGSHNCQAGDLCQLLEAIREGRLLTNRLILNGDVFDSYDFRRLRKSHWRVLSLLRKLSDEIDITWICGNHDGSADIISHLLGVEVRDEYILETGDERVLLLHGHVFDEFLDSHPILTWVGDQIYYILQKLDGTHRFAKIAKHSSKTFLRCAQKIEDGARNYARKKECSTVCCGHTHLAICNESEGIRYFNSGCWTELPCTYLTVKEGDIQLKHWVVQDEAVVEAVELVPAP